MPLLSMPSLCVNFIIIIFLFLVSSPTSDGAENENYTTCQANKYNCGEQIKGIGYPFWGEYRPQFCGVQGFGLTCYGNGSTTIVIQNQTFHVLHINQSTHNMTIARADLWDNLCPVELSNTTLNWSLFDYGPHPHVLNLTLFYDCPPVLASYDQIQGRSHFQCPGGQSSSNMNFFIEELSLINPPYYKSIKVPVFQEGLHAFWGDEHMTLEELVKQGFEADYHEMDKFQACDLCNDSGGECGTDTTTNQAICFCHDGNQPQKCQGGKKLLNMNIAIVVISMLVGAAILVTCASLIFWFRKKTSTYKSIFFWRKSTMTDDNVEAFLKINGSLVPKRYGYSSIKKVIRNVTKLSDSCLEVCC